jgi:hypothetical protein
MKNDKINWNFIKWYQSIRKRYPVDNTISISRYRQLKRDNNIILLIQ